LIAHLDTAFSQAWRRTRDVGQVQCIEIRSGERRLRGGKPRRSHRMSLS